jgi:hypothetical protein
MASVSFHEGSSQAAGADGLPTTGVRSEAVEAVLAVRQLALVAKLRLLAGLGVLLAVFCGPSPAGAAPRVEACSLLTTAQASALLGGPARVGFPGRRSCGFTQATARELSGAMPAVAVRLQSGAAAKKSYEKVVSTVFVVAGTSPHGGGARTPGPHRLHCGRTVAYYTGPGSAPGSHGQPAMQGTSVVAPKDGCIVMVEVTAPTGVVAIGKRAMADVPRRP